MRITIRFGSETDASALAELAARTFEETFAADNRDEDMALYLAEAYGTSLMLARRAENRELLEASKDMGEVGLAKSVSQRSSSPSVPR